MKPTMLHIMIPVYGASNYLRDTLAAVTKNLPSNTLITVVEDPSPDYDSKKLVSEFPTIEYVKNQERLGITENFNNCFSLSKGTYTQIIGSDDSVTSHDYTEIFNDEIFRNNNTIPDLIIFDASVIDEKNNKSLGLADLVKKILKPKTKGYIKNNSLIKTLLIGQWVYFPATLWKTSEIQKNRFDNKYLSAFDLNTLLFFCVENKKIYYMNKKIIAYRRHRQSVSSIKASDGSRFSEELNIHKQYYQIFIKNKNFSNSILAKLALTVRINKLYSFLKNKLIDNKSYK